MFNLFKSKVDKNIYAPVKGKCIDITEVNDIGFASLSMGDGIAIIPDTQRCKTNIIHFCNIDRKSVV